MLRTLLAGLLLLTSIDALACSCVVPAGSQKDHVRREFKQSAAIFSAYVHSIHFEETGDRRTRMARLRVMQVWKGDIQPNSWLDVISDDDTGLTGCTYVAELDQALMVYVSGKKPYALATCSLTGPLEQATGDIPLLNKLATQKK